MTVSSDEVILDILRAMCAAAWIMFFLIMKNIVLVIMLAVQRKRQSIYPVPEDVNTFGGGRQPFESADDWSLAGRIQKVLTNETEYVPYFLAQLIIIFCTITLTSQASHHYLDRVLGYGIVFTIARYLHTICYLLRNSHGRILGFFITILILLIITIDHIYFMSKRLSDYVPKP